MSATTEVKICKNGHSMKSKIGKDGKRHYYCQKCANKAARQRRARNGSSGSRKLAATVSLIFNDNALWGSVNGDYYRSQEDKAVAQ